MFKQEAVYCADLKRIRILFIEVVNVISEVVVVYLPVLLLLTSTTYNYKLFY